VRLIQPPLPCRIRIRQHQERRRTEPASPLHPNDGQHQSHTLDPVDHHRSQPPNGPPVAAPPTPERTKERPPQWTCRLRHHEGRRRSQTASPPEAATPTRGQTTTAPRPPARLRDSAPPVEATSTGRGGPDAFCCRC